MTMKLDFLGAVGTVTGSKYLLSIQPFSAAEAATQKPFRLLIDCGLFQGYKNLRELNWQPFAFDPRTIDAVVLTHAHLDHSGALPLLVKQGFSGPIYATAATVEAASLLLLDSGHLQEKEALLHRERKSAKRADPKPLYTQQEAARVGPLFAPLGLHQTQTLAPNLQIRLQSAGHILGAASVWVQGPGGSVFFSGDVGRPDDLLMRPPESIPTSDYVVMESTYGNRVHEDSAHCEEALARIITQTVARGGSVVIPAFAVGRSQLLLHMLARLRSRHAIPAVPLFLDSPLAIEMTHLYAQHSSQTRLSAAEIEAMKTVSTLSQTAQSSREIDLLHRPCVVISASGMAEGGRILHHLQHFCPDRRNAVVLVGYQAGGTRGARLAAHEPMIKIFGEHIKVKCEVVQLHGLSAHADSGQLIEWLAAAATKPKRLFLTHGESEAADQLRIRIQEQLKLAVTVPLLGQSAVLE